MKKCPWCGKEYPDEATVCAIDQTALLQRKPVAAPTEKPADLAASNADQPAADPVYQRKALDGLTCEEEGMGNTGQTTPIDAGGAAQSIEARYGPLGENLAMLLKEEPERLRILEIREAQMEHLKLNLVALVADRPKGEYRMVDITCTNVLDYDIRPMNPELLEGGPLIEHHELPPETDPPKQMIPGGDGDLFDPPLKLSELVLDQTYVLAEKFEIRDHYSASWL